MVEHIQSHVAVPAQGIGDAEHEYRCVRDLAEIVGEEVPGADPFPQR